MQYDAPDWLLRSRREHFDVYFYEREATAPGGRVLADVRRRGRRGGLPRGLGAVRLPSIARRIPLLVYPTHAEFAVTNAVDLPVYAEGIGGVTELFKNRIAVPFTGDWRDFRRVIHHELVHAVVNDLYYGGSLQSLDPARRSAQIPLWFNEGLAEYSAQGWDTQSDMYVREAILNDRLAPTSRACAATSRIAAGRACGTSWPRSTGAKR